jgi:hypothetical protein
MTLTEAKILRAAIDNAIALAESVGLDSVDIAAQAAALDDNARAELDAAIQEAESFGSK